MISGNIQGRGVVGGNVGGRRGVNGDITNGSGGGSTVTITPVLESGVKIADFEIDGESGDLFAPSQTSYNILKHVLYTDPVRGTNPVNTPIVYDNDNTLNSYDIIFVYYGDQLDPTEFFGTVIIPSLNLNDIFYCGYSGRVNRSIFNNDSFTQLSVSAPGEDYRHAPHVYKIVGVKLGAIV